MKDAQLLHNRIKFLIQAMKNIQGGLRYLKLFAWEITVKTTKFADQILMMEI
jgi:hypothetical protein